MKSAKMSTILVLALGLVVWPAPMVYAAQYLTVNGESVDSKTLLVGQSCTIEVVSDDGASYGTSGSEWYFFGIVDSGLGDLTLQQIMPAAGSSASAGQSGDEWLLTADGSGITTGTHFVFEYAAQTAGQTNIRLVMFDFEGEHTIDSVGITINEVQVAVGTAFTYQGRLADANSPADGLYDFEFSLYDYPNVILGNQVGSTIDINDLDVIDGSFTLELDFGPDIFTGYARWLEVAVRQGDSSEPNDFTMLSPRQELTPTPYAIYAFRTSGISVDSSGNVGIGTTSPAAKLTVNGAILRDGSTMSGANADTHINLGTSSTTSGSYTTVGGGYSNNAIGTPTRQASTVSGGSNNTASGDKSTVSGGYVNIASGTASTVAGGTNNTASGGNATVSGGNRNTASNNDATVSGGRWNTASGSFAAVPGGYENDAAGNFSFAAGRRAKANHLGAFVWADSVDADFASTANSQFLIRASGGVGIGTPSPEGKLEVSHDGTSHDLVVDFSTGNVGIGTTNPVAKLQVDAGDIRIGSADRGIVFHGGGEKIIGTSGYGIDFQTANGTSRMTVLNNGNVGIGTNSPNEKLTVEGALSLDEISAPSASAGYGKIYVKSTDSKLYFKDDAGKEYELTAGGDDFVVGNFLICANDTERFTAAKDPVLLKETKISRGGTLTIKFYLNRSAPVNVYAQIYRNATPVGTLRTLIHAGPATFTEDISGWSKGDLVQVWGYTTHSSYYVYVSNLRLYADNPAEAGARY